MEQELVKTESGQMKFQRTRERIGTEERRGKRVRSHEGQKEDDVTKDASEQFAGGQQKKKPVGRNRGWSFIIDSCLQDGDSPRGCQFIFLYIYWTWEQLPRTKFAGHSSDAHKKARDDQESEGMDVSFVEIKNYSR